VAVLQGAVPDEPSIPVLVVAGAAGDRQAEAALCHRFAPAVRTFARRRLRTNDAVEEFAQDVFLRFVEALRAGQVAEPERVGGFILGICKNLARERARNAERRAQLWEQFGSALATLSDEPTLAAYQLAQLEDCLSQMPQRSREVIRFAFIDGQPAAAIASRLAMSEGNVRVVRHRAIEALRECMSTKVSWEGAS
jgi:RNA polymerase sigma-70 factor (ECF subfamily)